MDQKELDKKIKDLEGEIFLQRKKLSSDRMDISFGELINLYKDNELIIRPEYQRLFRWNKNQKTALIESILLGIPIPPIFVAEDEEGIWELVDGLQRVSTFISFFGELGEDLTRVTIEDKLETEENEENENDENDENMGNLNKWELGEGGLIKSLEDLNIDNLPNKYKINLKRAVCRVEILRGKSNIEMKYELFKRLNSGGSKLTPQEIRNAFYRGINPVVNELLLELSLTEDFVKLTNLNDTKKKELYDQELVLRFIALFNNQDKINESLENYLNSFMEEAIRNKKFDKGFFRTLFCKVMKLIRTLGDENIFRNERNLFIPSLFDGITVATAQNIELFESNPERLKKKIEAIKKDADFKKYSGTGSNSKVRIKNRITRANQIFSS